jgi:hypothetical protein
MCIFVFTEINTSTVEIKDERIRPIQKAKVRSVLTTCITLNCSLLLPCKFPTNS